jgi:crotonobetainyl-CoA:carnitine CoA-transferase CaiB-like acyl-CoA transferase
MSSPPKFWENLATAVGRPEMLEQPEFASRNARIEHYEGVIATLAPLFRTRPRAEWCERLAALGVPHSAILNAPEVLESPQADHLGICVETEGPMGPFRTIRSPVRYDGEATREVVAPPTLGQHNAEILGARTPHRQAG